MHCKALESRRTSSSPHVLAQVVLGALLARIEVLNRRKHPGARRVSSPRTSHFRIPPPHDHCSLWGCRTAKEIFFKLWAEKRKKRYVARMVRVRAQQRKAVVVLAVMLAWCSVTVASDETAKPGLRDEVWVRLTAYVCGA